MTTITFTPLTREHFTLLLQWLNEPVVQHWYNTGPSKVTTLQEVEKKLGPRIDKKDPVDCYVIHIGDVPVGYIQVYNARNSPRDGYAFSLIEPSVKQYQQLAAIDLYIGNPAYRGKGYGSKVISAFLQQIVKKSYDACMADPNANNIASVRSFVKAGFKPVMEIDLDNTSRVVVMVCVLKN